MKKRIKIKCDRAKTAKGVRNFEDISEVITVLELLIKYPNRIEVSKRTKFFNFVKKWFNSAKATAKRVFKKLKFRVWALKIALFAEAKEVTPTYSEVFGEKSM